MEPVPAVGYVRPVGLDPPLYEQYVSAIEHYARATGLAVVCVFRDEGASDFAAQRAGFTRVLGELRTHRARVVIVPSPEHLSSLSDARGTLIKVIQNVGGELHVIQPRGVASPLLVRLSPVRPRAAAMGTNWLVATGRPARGQSLGAVASSTSFVAHSLVSDCPSR